MAFQIEKKDEAKTTSRFTYIAFEDTKASDFREKVRMALTQISPYQTDSIAIGTYEGWLMCEVEAAPKRMIMASYVNNVMKQNFPQDTKVRWVNYQVKIGKHKEILNKLKGLTDFEFITIDEPPASDEKVSEQVPTQEELLIFCTKVRAYIAKAKRPEDNSALQALGNLERYFKGQRVYGFTKSAELKDTKRSRKEKRAKEKAERDKLSGGTLLPVVPIPLSLEGRLPAGVPILPGAQPGSALAPDKRHFVVNDKPRPFKPKPAPITSENLLANLDPATRAKLQDDANLVAEDFNNE